MRRSKHFRLLRAEPLEARLLLATLHVDDMVFMEGQERGGEFTGGTVSQRVPVHLSQALLHDPVTVNYATQDGSAVAGEDYIATSGELVFLPGETLQWITVDILRDADQTTDFGRGSILTEDFSIQLSSANGASLTGDADDEAVITIVDSDSTGVPAPTPEWQIFSTQGEGSSEVTVTANRLNVSTILGVPLNEDDTDESCEPHTPGLDPSDPNFIGRGESCGQGIGNHGAYIQLLDLRKMTPAFIWQSRQVSKFPNCQMKAGDVFFTGNEDGLDSMRTGSS